MMDIRPYYYGIAAVLMLITAAFGSRQVRRGRLSWLQAVSAMLLIPYLFLILSTTVFDRAPGEPHIKLVPFWSYRAYFTGQDDELLPEIILNWLMLLPVGLLMPALLKKHRYRNTVLFGFLFSWIIELSQLVTARGWFEFDDIINNTAGVIFGCGIFWLVRRIVKGKT